jgi:hypothetical protein
MLQKFTITTCAFILFLFGFTLISVAPVKAQAGVQSLIERIEKLEAFHGIKSSRFDHHKNGGIDTRTMPPLPTPIDDIRTQQQPPTPIDPAGCKWNPAWPYKHWSREKHAFCNELQFAREKELRKQKNPMGCMFGSAKDGSRCLNGYGQ